MMVKLATVEDRNQIDSYLEKIESSTLYHDFRWGKLIEKTFGHKNYYLLCEEDCGRICGVLPLVHIKSRIFGNLLVSMPFFNYGGVCADNTAYRDRLIEEAVKIAVELGAGHIEFRQVVPFDNGFPVKTHKVSMRLRLPGSTEELWKSFPSKLKSQIRRPQKEAMSVRIDGIEEIESFYKAFSICMKNLGTPVYPKAFFRNIMEDFPESTWICTVYLGDSPVASGFLAGFKKSLEIPWAASIPVYNRFSPNMLLYWNCLKFACEKGFTEFDFGRSTADGGTYKFKAQWGAIPVPLNWYYWLRNSGTIPDLTNRNPKYRLAIALWKKLPVSVTRILGPKIVKNIP